MIEHLHSTVHGYLAKQFSDQSTTTQKTMPAIDASDTSNGALLTLPYNVIFFAVYPFATV